MKNIFCKKDEKLKKLNVSILCIFITFIKTDGFSFSFYIYRPQFCLGPHVTPGNVYGCSKLQKFVSKTFCRETTIKIFSFYLQGVDQPPGPLSLLEKVDERIVEKLDLLHQTSGDTNLADVVKDFWTGR